MMEGGRKGQPLSFDVFIQRINQPDARELVKHINRFMLDFRAKPPDVQADSKDVQEFLSFMERAFAQHVLWAGCSRDELDASVEGLEKYLMTKLYDRTFAQDIADRERDSVLAARLAALQFVRPEHLELAPDFADDGTLVIAQKQLKGMNLCKCPRDKLGCILECCRIINSLLASRRAGAGADDLTPTLIYVLIKAVPEYLASNLAFIERYRGAARLVSEDMYYFVQMQGAAAFVETLTTRSLKVDGDLLLAHMLAAGAISDAEFELMAAQHHQPQQQPQQPPPPQQQQQPKPGSDFVLQGALPPPPPPPDLLTWDCDDDAAPQREQPRTPTLHKEPSQQQHHQAQRLQQSQHATPPAQAAPCGRPSLDLLSGPAPEAKAPGLSPAAASFADGDAAHDPLLAAPFESLTMADVRMLLQHYKDAAARTGVGGGAAATPCPSGDAPACGAPAGSATGSHAGHGTVTTDGRSATLGPGVARGGSGDDVPGSPQTEAMDDSGGPPFELHVASPWFEHIASGRKDVEGRLRRGMLARLQPGHVLHLIGGRGGRGGSAGGMDNDVGTSEQGTGMPSPPPLRAEVVEVRCYPSFARYLEFEGLLRTLPGVDSVADGVAVYRGFYSEADELLHGVAAVQLRLIAGNEYKAGGGGAASRDSV